MRQAGFLSIIAFALAPLLPAQQVVTHTASRFRIAALAPATCNPGDVYFNSFTGIPYHCTLPNTWTPFGAGIGAPIGAKYIVQQADATLTAEQAMGALATGLVKNTTTTGAQSIAVGDTDYTLPATLNTHTVATVAHGGTGAVVGTTNTQALINKTLIDYSNHVHANATHTRVRNDTAGDLTKGTPVYITGYNVGLDVATVAAAKADSATTLPAIGLLEADIAKNATGESLGVGVMLNVKTDHAGWAVGDKLWISTTTAGTLTKTRPTGSTNFVQRMGIVLRRHASLGIIEIIGAHRSNSLPLDIDAALIGGNNVSDVEFDYLDGVTGAIQGQINGKQASDAELTAVAGLSGTGLVVHTGAGTMTERTVTGTADEIDVANGNGVAGNPTLSLAAAVGKWIKYTVAYTAPEFEAADTDAAVDLFTLPANGIIEAIRIKHSVAFAGTAVTSVVCSVGDAAGDTADDDAYMPAFNVFQVVGDTVADYDGGAYSTTAAQQTVQLHCVCNVNFGDGAGTTALSAGSVDVTVKWAVLP